MLYQFEKILTLLHKRGCMKYVSYKAYALEFNGMILTHTNRQNSSPSYKKWQIIMLSSVPILTNICIEHVVFLLQGSTELTHPVFI